MVEIEIVREWIEKADEDFEFARINPERGQAFLCADLFPFSAIR